jgi:cysteine desulfurase
VEDKIQSLRRIGDFDGAVNELLQSLARGERDAYLRHVIGGRCLLLDWARGARAAPFDRERFSILARVSGASAALIQPRLDVLEAICGGPDPERIFTLLQRAVTAYETCWQYRQWPFVAYVAGRLAAGQVEPAFMLRLNPESRPPLRRLAAQFGWLHPGLLLVGETWAYVWNGAADLPQDHRVTTWGLLAKVDHPKSDGVVAKLTLERVPGWLRTPDGDSGDFGRAFCGALYPHPLSGGYLPTEASFQDALQNAWWAVIGRLRASCAFDVRWSLEVLDRSTNLPLDVTNLPLDVVVRGRSMEAALAAALQALVRGEPLDQHVAVTARFKAPGSDDLTLDKVTAIRDKLLAPEFAETARLTQIREIVVADTQHEVTENGTADAKRTAIANGEVTLIPVPDLDSAYRHLGRWARITQAANKCLAEAAQQILDQRCDPYVKPRLSREDQRAERRCDAFGRPERIPVEPEERERIVRGQLPQRTRLAVLGESGMGKSMFLVYCEQRIAAADGPWLPLRLGAGPKATGGGRECGTAWYSKQWHGATVGPDTAWSSKQCHTEGNREAVSATVAGSARSSRGPRLAAACSGKGHLITQPTEHKCVLESFRRLEQQGWLVTYLPVDRFARVAPDDLRRAIRGNTVLVSVMAANNEVGTLQSIREVAEICRERGILFHTDAAQAVGKMDLDLQDVPVDILSLSGHKIYGPKGVGALVVKGRGTRVRLRPIMDGGDQEFGLRAGTLPVPLIAGLGVACQLCRELQPVEAVRIQRQRDRLWEGLRAGVDDVVLNGHPTERLPGNLNVSFPGVDPKRLLCNLDAIAVSAGSACNSAKLTPSHVLTAMGVAPELALSTIRFGLGRFTTDADIEEAIEVVVDAARRSRTG